MSSYNELLCLKLCVFLPGYKMTEDELYGFLNNETWFADSSVSYKSGDPKVIDDILQDTLVVVNRWDVASELFESILETELHNLSFADLFGHDVDELPDIWTEINKEVAEIMADREKVDKNPLPVLRTLTDQERFYRARHEILLSLNFLVRSAYDYDSYSGEADFTVEILHRVNLNKLPDTEKESEITP